MNTIYSIVDTADTAEPPAAAGLTATPNRQQSAANPLDLRHGDRLLLDLMERTTGACIWVIELSPQRVHLSARMAALLGLTPAATASAEWFEPLHFYAPQSRERMAAALAACIEQAMPFDEQVQIITAAGSKLSVRTIGEALSDAQGKVVGIQGVMQDLADHERLKNESPGVTMRLSTTLASSKEAFVTLDHEGCFNHVNAAAEQLLLRSSGELLGRPLWRELDDRADGRLEVEIRSALEGSPGIEFEDFVARLGKWLQVRAYPLEKGVALYLRDVTVTRQAQEQMLLLQTSISRLSDTVLITEAPNHADPVQRIVFVNDAFERLTGYSRQEVMGQTPRMFQGKNTQRLELDRIRSALLQGKPVRAELINYKKSGQAFWLELDIIPVEHFSRGVTHWVSVARDITERRAAVDEIEHLAHYDALTQLPNRKLLMDRLEGALTRDDSSASIGALMLIDLDHFKVLNDTLGHAKGDLLLQQVATRLAGCLRLGDTVARLGGDEFVVMLEDLGLSEPSATACAGKVGMKVLATLSEPYELAGHQHHGTCSMGITCFGQRKESVGDLLKQADLAMYQAKAAGRNTLCFFDPLMQAAANANAAVSSELRQGLHDGQFVLYYQPQVGNNNKMFAVEALIRWQHPQRGLVLPGEFIAQAEENGLILPLGSWVLEAACAQLAVWAKKSETAHLCIAVNVSALQFRNPEFVDLVMRIITQAGIAASRLKLELTESLLAKDMEITIAKLGMLKKMGVTLAIDDFGMGYSALSYLKHLPLDQLKIDRSFVKDLLTDPNDAAIARTIIGLAQSLGLEVIAEGVENEAQRALLARFGCECYQGYYYCQPLPIDELELFMAKAQAVIE
jgi:diguanylate cyclase (GGDEF)-like protein/PAS domain S-box-containing protein